MEKYFRKRYAGAILMDLSKAFDTLNYDDRLIAKLHAYGFSEESLKLIKSYLTKGQHQFKQLDWASLSNITRISP